MIRKLKMKFLKLSDGKREISVNIGLSFISKALGLIISFATVPILLSYLGKDTYGMWLTIFSIVSWMSFFDLGLGNGLRNYLTHSFTSGNIKEGKEYISTAYWFLSAFIITCLVIIQIVFFYVSWDKIFKPNINFSENLNSIVSICLWGFGALLISRLIVSILQAKKQVGISNVIFAFGNVLSLFLIIILSNFESNSKLFNVALIFTWSTPVVLIIYTFYYFLNSNKNLIPSFRNIKKSLGKNIFGLGVKFFLAQFLVMILNQSANIIITQILSPSDVTVYFIPWKLFSVISISIGLIATNLIPYFTEAKALKDNLKMKRILNKFFKIYWIIILFFLLILLFSKTIIRIWTSSQIEIPFSLIILHFLLAAISGANGIYSSFLSGIGNLKGQIISFLIAVIIFIPMSIMLGKSIGLNGIVISLIIAQTPVFIVLRLQSGNILRTKLIEV